MSNSSALPSILHKFPLGDCLRFIIEINNTTKKFFNKNGNETYKQKQIIASSALSMDDQKPINLGFVRKVCNIKSFPINDKIQKAKYDFKA